MAISALATLLVLAAIALTAATPSAWPFLAASLLFALGCLFERRYRGAAPTAPDAAFQPTSERFVDPETGRMMTVWSDPRTGARRYVDEAD